MSNHDLTDPIEGLDIAIIGMACRFPGAANVDEFWRNLCEGKEAITQFTDEELKSFGVDLDALGDPDFVKAGSILRDIDLFDAAFFGYSPNEASLLDPQHRIFLECAWHTLENDGSSELTILCMCAPPYTHGDTYFS